MRDRIIICTLAVCTIVAWSAVYYPDTSWTTIIENISNTFVAIAAVVTAYVAIRGINRWRAEIKDKANFEVARNLAKATYKLRDAFWGVRGPMVLSQEFPEFARNGFDDLTNIQQAEAYQHVFQHRWEPLSESIQEYDTAVLEAEVVWGEDIRGLTNTFRQCIRSLQVSIDQYVRNQARGVNRDDADRVEEEVFSHRDAEDRLTIRVNEALNALEDELRRHLRRDGEN